MNKKFSVIEKENNPSDKPIKAFLKNEIIDFTFDSTGWVSESQGLLKCSRCKYELKMTSFLSKKNVNNLCPECKIMLQWDLDGQWQFQTLIESSTLLLKKFFTDKNFKEIPFEQLEMALSFVEEENKEILFLTTFKLMSQFMIETDKRLNVLEKNNEYEKSVKVKNKSKRKRNVDENVLIEREETQPRATRITRAEEANDIPF